MEEDEMGKMEKQTKLLLLLRSLIWLLSFVFKLPEFFFLMSLFNPHLKKKIECRVWTMVHSVNDELPRTLALDIQ